MEKEPSKVDDQLFQMMLSKQNAIHQDVRQIQVTLNEHISKDEAQYREIWFIKRAFQITWTVLAGAAGFLGWTGMKSQ